MDSPNESKPGFTVVSRFRVIDASEAVRTAFRERPHEVENSPGFLRMDVMSPLEDSCEFWLITHWIDRQSYEAFYGGHMYKKAHSAVPVGLQVEPGSVSISHFEHVAV